MKSLLSKATVCNYFARVTRCTRIFLFCCLSIYSSAMFAKQFSPSRNMGESLNAGSNDTNWMVEGKYGIFIHYQYRILLGYSFKTEKIFPDVSEMSAEEWNKLVDGFNVKEFANQMAEGGVGWVIFCIDDAQFGWQCAPNETFCKYTGYAPGERCSRRDLIMDLADALNPKGVKLICYYAGLNNRYMRNPKIAEGLKDNLLTRAEINSKVPPTAECKKRRTAVLREYAERYKEKIAGWWFDAMQDNAYSEEPYDWWTIKSIVHNANPKAVIAFSHGRNNYSPVMQGIDNYTGGDTWSKQNLTELTPEHWPPKNDILWHAKIYCGNIYHGQGDDNQFGNQELVDWIKTCNKQGGICTLDWPFNPETGLIKDFGMKQMIAIKNKVK